jgi:pimeloyl-ACP methyl ester carboxylesterase/protein-tyrosine phosphatase
MSAFEQKSWEAYTTESLAELLDNIIEDYRDKEAGQGVVLIGHSMGCSISALLASKTSPNHSALSDHVVGLVTVCPRAEAPTEEETAMFKKLLWIPSPIFNLWRKWDRRGGIDSKSVHRFVGADADEETRRLQYRFNDQSKTDVWRRMASGSLPHFNNGIGKGGLPGGSVWAGLEVPVFLVAGEADNITKPGEIEKIAAFLGKSHPVQIELDEDSEPIVDSAAPVDTAVTEEKKPANGQIMSSVDVDSVEANPNTTEEVLHEDPSTPNEELSAIPLQPVRPKKILKTTILPAPASHALLYQPATVRILAGLISDFLCSQVSPRLSLGWQLQFLSTAGKWDVKNLAKWQAVNPVSEPIAGVFRAMKTLREVDDTHCPEVFVRNWGSQVKDIVDISHESPVYDPRGLERGGVHYHKFPTVSKIPPTGDEVTAFITLVDRLIEEQKVRAEKEGWGDEWYVGVHCHYGFNRTGYFVVCYLVERLGYNVQKAIDEFAKRRPRGIKHAHFLDQLFVRYCKGLKRAPTL